MDDFESFDEEYDIRIFDQDLLDQFYDKEGIKLTNKYPESFPPGVEKQLVKLVEKNVDKPLKVIRGLEKFVDKYPDSVAIKYQLFLLFKATEYDGRAEQTLMRMVEEHPDDILVVSLLMDGLREPEELKKYEYLFGKGREASSFFGVDKEIHVGDYCDYQMAACHYEAFTGDFIRAKNRVRILLDLGYEREGGAIVEMMRKIAANMVNAIGQREEEYERTGKMPEKDEDDEPEIIDDRVESLMQEHIISIMMEMKEYKERIELGLEDEDYWDDDEDGEYDYIEPVEQVVRDSPKVGRNDPCPCGSGKKYKKCCL